ncbi:hypothetical protein PHET_10318 [Paragonimus heterotremus]|uniref:Uncharacterized protein n=1 Tax=Paragonimus heterotremus TaxID=100268 RepID=A0A8J4SZ47_9TREM|nr:hypothetical protein PHET_10318 [Paragonimus heterotremus]
MFSAGFLDNLSYNKTISYDSFPIIKCTSSSGHIEESLGSTSVSINVTKVDQEDYNSSNQNGFAIGDKENALQQGRVYSRILRSRNIVVPECIDRGADTSSTRPKQTKFRGRRRLALKENVDENSHLQLTLDGSAGGSSVQSFLESLVPDETKPHSARKALHLTATSQVADDTDQTRVSCVSLFRSMLCC